MRKQSSGDIRTVSQYKPLGGYVSDLPYTVALQHNPYSAPTDHPRLEWHLDNWSRYMRNPELDALGFSLTDYWPISRSDFDSMVHSVDERCAVVVDALISDLVFVQRAAINTMHLGAVFSFDEIILDVTYLSARMNLSAGLIRKGIP